MQHFSQNYQLNWYSISVQRITNTTKKRTNTPNHPLKPRKRQRQSTPETAIPPETIRNEPPRISQRADDISQLSSAHDITAESEIDPDAQTEYLDTKNDDPEYYSTIPTKNRHSILSTPEPTDQIPDRHDTQPMDRERYAQILECILMGRDMPKS